MAEFTFKGWRTFRNTGTLYREWTLDEDLPALGAVAKDQVVDGGPSRGAEKRFSLYSSDGEQKGTLAPELVAEVLFKGDVPPWRPPRTCELTTIKALQGIVRSLDGIRAELRKRNDASKALDQVRKLVEPKKPATAEKQNEFLRLKGEHTYSSGDPFTDWELLVDVPELQVTRVEGANPMHAVKGDVLREEPGDQLTPFELRRDGARIADPEWWQVRHLFVGLKDTGSARGDDQPRGGDSRGSDPLAARLNRCIPDDGRVRHYAYVVTRAIPEVGLRPGDFLVRLLRGKLTKRGAATIRRPFERVPRGKYQALVENIENLEMVREGDWTTDLAAHLRSGPARRGRDETSPLIIFRELVAPVSEPIRASSDDAALFELLTQVGGLMPKE